MKNLKSDRHGVIGLVFHLSGLLLPSAHFHLPEEMFMSSGLLGGVAVKVVRSLHSSPQLHS